VGINVNVAAAQLADDGFADLVLGVLARADLRPGLLTLEILETALNATTDLRGRLRRLRDAGVRLAIDDFGRGSRRSHAWRSSR
jgi:EAL domain-containing protein (putative c-di-GMP-specific phosphodiesterase class I)